MVFSSKRNEKQATVKAESSQRHLIYPPMVWGKEAEPAQTPYCPGHSPALGHVPLLYAGKSVGIGCMGLGAGCSHWISDSEIKHPRHVLAGEAGTLEPEPPSQ